MAKVVIFGRAKDCDVVIDDEYASPHHARAVQEDDGRVWVEDLGSTNGTWIQRDGGPLVRAVGRTPIAPGVTVRIGRTAIPWSAPAVSEEGTNGG